MNIKCPVCSRDSFHPVGGHYEHWCLKAGRWITWQAGVFKAQKGNLAQRVIESVS